jgi:hypothetical protein
LNNKIIIRIAIHSSVSTMTWLRVERQYAGWSSLPRLRLFASQRSIQPIPRSGREANHSSFLVEGFRMRGFIPTLPPTPAGRDV